MSWLFASGGRSIGASASVLPGQADVSPGVQGPGLSTDAPSVMLRKQHPSCYPHFFPWNVTSCFVEEAPSCLHARKCFSPIWKLFNQNSCFREGIWKGFPKQASKLMTEGATISWATNYFKMNFFQRMFSFTAAVISNLLGTRDRFQRRQFFHGLAWEGGWFQNDASQVGSLLL